VFGFKPPRRWDHCGVRLIPPRPFYDREDGHFLLNNTCTLVHLHMKPELRRLQCYWLPKLPKLIHPVSYHPPVPRVMITYFEKPHQNLCCFSKEKLVILIVA